MDFEKIKELINLVDSSSLAFFELESNNDRIKMDKSLNRAVADNNFSGLSNAGMVNNLGNTNNVLTSTNSIQKIESDIKKTEEIKTSENIEKEVVIDDKDLSVITSPMVGTFYASASPESPSFVKVGDTIAKGKVICIIEAMKLMNEIESEYDGVIVECLAKDGDMVEYGQPIFKVKGE